MRKILFLSISCLFLAINTSIFSQSKYIETIQKERDEFEKELFTPNEILKPEEIENIEELRYFPIDSSWVLTATFKKKKGKPFKMPTTTARTPNYQQIGHLHFERNGEKFQLVAYKNLDLDPKKYKDYVFVPFRDLNSPDLTYGGGRYLDVSFKVKRKVKVVVDFNKAYNPYCVYSHRYSCPITPQENHIHVKIEAGVMNPIKKED